MRGVQQGWNLNISHQTQLSKSLLTSRTRNSLGSATGLLARWLIRNWNGRKWRRTLQRCKRIRWEGQWWRPWPKNRRIMVDNKACYCLIAKQLLHLKSFRHGKHDELDLLEARDDLERAQNAEGSQVAGDHLQIGTCRVFHWSCPLTKRSRWNANDFRNKRLQRKNNWIKHLSTEISLIREYLQWRWRWNQRYSSCSSRSWWSDPSTSRWFPARSSRASSSRRYRETTSEVRTLNLRGRKTLNRWIEDKQVEGRVIHELYDALTLEVCRRNTDQTCLNSKNNAVEQNQTKNEVLKDWTLTNE